MCVSAAYSQIWDVSIIMNQQQQKQLMKAVREEMSKKLFSLHLQRQFKPASGYMHINMQACCMYNEAPIAYTCFEWVSGVSYLIKSPVKKADFPLVKYWDAFVKQTTAPVSVETFQLSELFGLVCQVQTNEFHA